MTDETRIAFAMPGFNGHHPWDHTRMCPLCESVELAYSHIGFPHLTGDDGTCALGPAFLCHRCGYVVLEGGVAS